MLQKVLVAVRVLLHKTVPAVILNVRIETKSRDYKIDPFQSIVAAIREVYPQWRRTKKEENNGYFSHNYDEQQRIRMELQLAPFYAKVPLYVGKSTSRVLWKLSSLSVTTIHTTIFQHFCS